MEAMLYSFDIDGVHESRVTVIARGEDKVRVRNDSTERVKMGGPHKWLNPGELAVVDKSLLWSVH